NVGGENGCGREHHSKANSQRKPITDHVRSGESLAVEREQRGCQPLYRNVSNNGCSYAAQHDTGSPRKEMRPLSEDDPSSIRTNPLVTNLASVSSFPLTNTCTPLTAGSGLERRQGYRRTAR